MNEYKDFLYPSTLRYHSENQEFFIAGMYQHFLSMPFSQQMTCKADTCGFILKYDNDGALKAHRNVNSDGYAALTDLALTKDGNRLMSGYSKGNTNYTGQNTSDTTYPPGFFLARDCQELVTGIKKPQGQGNGLKVYPNPAHSRITNERGEEKEKLSLKLINPHEQTVLKTSVSNKQKSLDVSHLSQGVYFVKINSPDQDKAHMKKKCGGIGVRFYY